VRIGPALRRGKLWNGLWLLFVDTLAAEDVILGALAAAVAAATAADVVRAQDLVQRGEGFMLVHQLVRRPGGEVLRSMLEP
jgi:hypothetical protein